MFYKSCSLLVVLNPRVEIQSWVSKQFQWFNEDKCTISIQNVISINPVLRVSKSLRFKDKHILDRQFNLKKSCHLSLILILINEGIWVAMVFWIAVKRITTTVLYQLNIWIICSIYEFCSRKKVLTMKIQTRMRKISLDK